jgi:very-short-patch-repair endonuclease
MQPGEGSKIGIIIAQTIVPEKLQVAQTQRRKMTSEEQRLWQYLRGSRLGSNFRRQQIVQGFVADFYCNPARLAIEADSPSHDRGYDAERDRIFASLGILVLRFTNEQIRNDLPHVLQTIRETIRKRMPDADK